MRAGVLGGWCAGLWVVAQLLGSASAAAAELSIATPAACAVADELTFRTERALGQPIESAAAVRCTIHIARSAGMYAARMEVETIGSGRPSRLRSFLAPTCAKLTETLALAVVLAIGAGPEDITAGASDAPAAGPAGAGAEAAQATLAVNEASATLQALQGGTPVPPDDAEASAGRPKVAVSAALVGDTGTLPGTGLGVSFGAALGGESFELRLLGTFLPAREASIETSNGSGGVEVGLLAGNLAGCLPRLLRASRLELGACAGAELGWLSGNGTGVDISRSGGTLWTALRADATARWLLGDGGFGLDLLVSALVPTDRDEFTISEVGPVFQTGAVVGRASIGASFVFGGSGSNAR